MAAEKPEATAAKKPVGDAVVGILVLAIVLPIVLAGGVAIANLTIGQLGTMLVSFAFAPIPLQIIAYLLRDAPLPMRIAGTLFFYLIGCWISFNLATYFEKDAHWGWAHAPASWCYFFYKFTEILWNNRGYPLGPVVKAFMPIAFGNYPK